jgi:catechol 2,3-dioxygenase
LREANNLLRVPDAVQRFFSGAPQSRDPIPARKMGPGLAAHRHSVSKTRVNALMALRSIRGTETFLSGEGNMPENSTPVIAGTRIGHVHLKVADLDRALGFYCGVLGFELTQRLSSGAAFISAGGYHHHIGLNTWESKGGHPPPPGTTGLFHTAILYPTRPALADALHRVMQAGIHLDGASDHGVSEALYLRDPDENGVELYWDRPKEQWPRKPDGSLAMFTHRLDLEELLRQREA